MLKSINPFLILTISVFILLFAPLAIQDGMFMDGTLYASVAKNLAHGKGTFWFQSFSNTIFLNFHEQLPIFGFTESLFFRILGDSIYTEFVFAFVLALVAFYYCIKIWKVTASKEDWFYSWFPIFCWIVIPVVFWSYINAVQETLMVVFALSSIYYMLCAVKLKSKVFINLTLSAILILLCSFCKGFQGLFPLVGIMFFWFSFRTISFKRAFLYSLFVFSIIALIVTVLLLNENSYNSLEAYFNSRIIGTFTNDYSSYTSNRFNLLWILFQELIPLILLSLIIFGISKLKKYKITSTYKKQALFFFLVGVSGSIPLMVTMEQRNFYLCTSLPFYALSFAFFVLPYLKTLIVPSHVTKKLRVMCYSVLLVALIAPLFFIGKTHRDQDKLSDIYKIGNYIGHGELLGIHPDLSRDYSTHMYFSRYFEISMERENPQSDFYLTLKDFNDVPSEYRQIKPDLVYFNLYKK